MLLDSIKSNKELEAIKKRNVIDH